MSKPISVLHISTLSSIGGVERRLIEYLESPSNPLIKHYVCCTSGKEDLITRIREMGIEVFVPKRLFRYDALAITEMARYMEKRRIDIVHSRNCVSNCWGGLAAILAGVPIKIGGEHGTIWVADGIRPRIENFNYNLFDLIIANSRATKRMIMRKRNVDERKIRVIHDGINTARFENSTVAQVSLHVDRIRREFSIRKDAKIVGSVGGLRPAKGFPVFIEAIPLVLEEYQNVVFMIVGDGDLRSDLERMVKRRGIEQDVIFTGWRNDVPEIMNVFDVYVSTSIRESLGNTLIEAGLARKPVIAPNIDGIPDIVVNGKTGILINPTRELEQIPKAFLRNVPNSVIIDGEFSEPKSVDPKHLAEAIVFLLRNPDVSRKYAQNGYDRAIRLFSMERYADELENTYMKLAKQKGILQ
jgi:glycosyltransferase involved in cell wall biosynthesis